ncbi:MAG: c-type cytochrome [Acidimicrobiales bacterium]
MFAVLVAVLAWLVGGPPANAEPAEDPVAEEPTGDGQAVEEDAPLSEELSEELSDELSEEEAEARAAEAALLAEGAEVYSQICSSCHQPGGVGLSGQYPPLLDNPAVDDASYVRGVIVNGLQGEITVAGETFDGVMPSFSTLSDDDIDAVIAYVQSGFVTPEGGEAALGPTGPVVGTELPGLASASALIAYLLAALVVGLVLYPRLASRIDRLDTPWLDAGLKTATIVVAIVFLTVVVPDWVLQLKSVAGMDRLAQDAIGLVVWGGGLVVCLGAMWYFHRESRI